MSEIKHTEGPLKLHEVGGLLCPATLNDLSLLTVATERDEFGDKTVFGAVYKPEDARRLVACWNACLDAPTDELEKMGTDFMKCFNDLYAEAQEGKRLKAILEDHGPEGHNVTNQQYVELRTNLERVMASLKLAAIDFASQNGTKPAWWKSVLDLYLKDKETTHVD
jgi:hypothetical protein